MATDNDSLRRSPQLFKVDDAQFARIEQPEGALLQQGEQLLFAGAERCAHCRNLWRALSAPTLQPLLADKTRRYLDADRFPELAAQLKVRGLPALLRLQNGEPVERAASGAGISQLAAWLDWHD